MIDNDKQKQDGVIIAYIIEKGYGFIDSSTLKKVFFHITDVQEAEIVPAVGEEVEFEVKKSEKGDGYAAKDVCRKWRFGRIEWLKGNEGDDWGFIATERDMNVYFRSSAISDRKNALRVGTYVKFTQIKEDKGMRALNAVTVDPCYGILTHNNSRNNSAEITPEGAVEPISVGSQNILPRRWIDEGASVTYLPAPGKPKMGICVYNEYALRRFANLGDEVSLLAQLKEKALEEDWEFPQCRARERNSILRSYLFYTFNHLLEEDHIITDPNRKKIRMVTGDDGIQLAIFDTGLVSRSQYAEIYGIFERDAIASIGKPQWRLLDFCSRGEEIRGKNYLTYYSELPPRAQYFKNPADLLYNHEGTRLDAITKHIVADRGHRLPKKLHDQIPKGMKDENEICAFLSSWLQMAIKRAQDRIKWNYKAAIPQYYSRGKCIQLLLPLCINNPRKVDVALAVQLEHKVYVGYTILTLQMAYSNARLIARPDSEWLGPTKIAEDEEDEEEASLD